MFDGKIRKNRRPPFKAMSEKNLAFIPPGLGDFGSSCGEVVKKRNRDCPNENQHFVATIFQEELKISLIFDGLFFDSPKIPGSEDHGMLPCTWLYAQEKIDASFNSQTIDEVNLKYNHVFFFKIVVQIVAG